MGIGWGKVYGLLLCFLVWSFFNGLLSCLCCFGFMFVRLFVRIIVEYLCRIVCWYAVMFFVLFGMLLCFLLIMFVVFLWDQWFGGSRFPHNDDMLGWLWNNCYDDWGGVDKTTTKSGVSNLYIYGVPCFSQPEETIPGNILVRETINPRLSENTEAHEHPAFGHVSER
jgi:hypothetical protein